MDSKFVKWEIKLFLTYKKTIERSYNRIHVSYICADIRVLNKIGIDVDWKFTNRVQTKISTAMSIACFVNSSIRVALPIAKCTNHDDNLVRPPFYNILVWTRFCDPCTSYIYYSCGQSYPHFSCSTQHWNPC